MSKNVKKCQKMSKKCQKKGKTWFLTNFDTFDIACVPGSANAVATVDGKPLKMKFKKFLGK